METYIRTISSMTKKELQNELNSLLGLSDKYKNEVRDKTNLIIERMLK